jgi:hypothetical protein
MDREQLRAKVKRECVAAGLKVTEVLCTDERPDERLRYIMPDGRFVLYDSPEAVADRAKWKK